MKRSMTCSWPELITAEMHTDGRWPEVPGTWYRRIFFRQMLSIDPLRPWLK